jgi:hypothetical protein
MTLIYPIFAAIISALIEGLRIKLSKGKVDNINKLWTYTIGFCMFGVCLALSVGYYDDIWPLDVACYAIYFASVRGVVYDPLLNVLRRLSVDYTSKTTNSIIDRTVGNRVNFWVLRIIYLAFALISGIIWITLLRKAQGIY